MQNKAKKLEQGIVIKSTGSWYTVRTEHGRVFNCKIKGTYRIRGIRATNPVAVGDYVEFNANPNESTGLITHIRERKNYIIRKSPKLSSEYQLIATNVDQAWLIASLIRPHTFTEFIDRFLVSAEAYSIPVNIVFNKLDLYNKEQKMELAGLISLYEDIGYPCFAVSATDGTNVDAVKEGMKDKLNIFSGNSGVGKSTLVNTIDPNLDLRIGSLSNFHESGKHTTTFAEMFELSFGGHIIDTPGIKGFGLIDFGKDELFHYFPEIFRYSGDCKFHNCSHTHEPGCAVIEAVKEGEISESRYISYLNMLEDEGGKYR